MDTTNSSANGTQSSTISSGSFNILVLNFLLFVISSSLFWVGISLAVLIHFVIKYILRHNNFDSVTKFHDETEDSYGKERFTGFDYIFEHNHDAFWYNNYKHHGFLSDNNYKNHDFPSDNIEKKHNSSDLNFQEELAKLDLKHGKKFVTFEENEKLESSFSFKFEYQMPEKNKEENLPILHELAISNETEVLKEKPIATRVQNYQTISEKNLRGFIEPPETLRISVKESLSDPKFLNFDTKERNLEFKLDEEISSSIQKVQRETKPEPKSKFENEIELELESKTEIKFESEIELQSEPKIEVKSEPEPEPKPESEAEPKTKSESEQFDRESWCENEPKYMHDDEITEEFIQKSPENKYNFTPVNEIEEYEIFETEIPLVKRKRNSASSSSTISRNRNSTSSSSTISSKERYKSRKNILSEEFSGFDSDSESSLSDGYSVKELIVDSDSDWFLSEKESSNHKREFNGNHESSNLVSYTVKFVDDFRNLNESKDQFAYIQNQDDEIEVSFENRSKTEFEEGKLEDNNSEEYEGANETKLEDNNNNLELESEGVNEIKLEEDDKLEEFEGVDETKSETNISLNIDADDYNAGDFNSHENTSVLMKEEFLDRETDSSNHENNIPPLENLDIEKPSEQPEKIENNLKNKGKEWLYEEEEEENDELESLWEHQDLIEQLKMEIKKAKATGLPTILEESETPKTTIEDLKPFRFDEKFLREDPMDELHKYYKSYGERMRKFDIFNYQKMYAVGFLQLKDPLESMGSQKPILPTITSILSQNLYKRRKSTDDPSEKFIRELRCDLETVYVGQMCLSWEFLRWQYEKTCEMPESDPFRMGQYNQSADEFQQFQVLINHFVENEPFQGHRLPNYVKNRCVLRNLLQVPVIKEDSMKEKSEEQKKGSFVIRSEELEDIMEESIRVFWEFVKADKDETPGILKGLMGPQVELEEPSDHSFMMRLHSILQKKEKRLKDHMRTGNCLVKKFKKAKEDRTNQDLFFSHVDIKLVSRVLKMPRITSEQLQWCHKKLEKISFVDRKIKREPSFLLFPC